MLFVQGTFCLQKSFAIMLILFKFQPVQETQKDWNILNHFNFIQIIKLLFQKGAFYRVTDTAKNLTQELTGAFLPSLMQLMRHS